MYKMRKIDQLNAILESQQPDPDNWPALDPKIEEGEDTLSLVVRAAEIGFVFDKSGEKLLGMYNWKE